MNLKLAFPFKIDDYTVGFRHNFAGDLHRGPEAIFVKRSFDAAEGTVTVDAEYESSNNLVSVAAKWVSDKLKLVVGVEGNTNDKITSVEVTSNEDVNGNKLKTTVGYDLTSQKLSGKAALSHEDTTIEVAYDTEEADPVVRMHTSTSI